MRRVLLLLAFGAALAVLGVLRLHSFLAVNAPVGARVLVVEGFASTPEELDQAVAAFRSGRYERVLTTGGPIHYFPGTVGPATLAERAAEYLKRRLPQAPITAVPAPDSAQDRTYASAVAVRDWAERSGEHFEALDVFSPGAHARRSRLLYQMAFGPKVRVGVLAATSPDYDAGAWWRTSYGAEEVVKQTASLIWVKCCFWPSATSRP